LGQCVLTGSVTAKAAVRVGRVGGRLDASSSTSVVLSAACAASAPSCTGVSDEVRTGPGGYSGACAWSEPALLWVLTNVTCTVTALDCGQEVLDAGLTLPANPNYILGTNGDDDIEYTDANDVVCGLDGSDFLHVGTAAAGDIFLGGAGDDHTTGLEGGTFIGGAGDDFLGFLDAGAFNGDAGQDRILNGMSAGTFNGGDGDDFLDGSLTNGTFNGDAGDDKVNSGVRNGTFNAGTGNDFVDFLENGTVNGGDGDDFIGAMLLGTFNGDAGNDHVDTLREGTFNGGDDIDYVRAMLGGTFDGGPGADFISGSMTGGTCANVETGCT
jgi:Ca2+-binding RTX toxin-like protein